MKIGVLTSGGDAPGMNAFLVHFDRFCKKNGFSLVGIRKGFQGLIENDIVPSLSSLFDIDTQNAGGSVLKCYRSTDFLTTSGFKMAQANLKKNGIDVLVGVGGDGTFRGLMDLKKQGFHVVGVPATIDNDMFFTDKTLGFDTALNTCVDLIDKIKETMASSDRGAIIEVMGRECGDLALSAALSVGADKVITKETGYDYNNLRNVCAREKNKGNLSPLIIVQEHILDVVETAMNIEKDLNHPYRGIDLGYAQRGGKPSVFDRIFALKLAYACVQNLKKEEKFSALTLKNENVEISTLEDAVTTKRRNNSALFEIVNR